MATNIFDLSEDLQISIIDRAPSSSLPMTPLTLQWCSMVCKLWRRLVCQRLDWPHLTLNLTTEEPGPEQQAANELFLTWFDPKWNGLKSLRIVPAEEDRSPKSPTFTAKGIAQLLPRAAHLTRVGFYQQEVAQLLAEDTAFKWFQSAHALRTFGFWGIIDNRVDKYVQHLPRRLENASFPLSSTLTTYGLARLNLPTNLKSLSLSCDSGSPKLSEKDLKGLAALTNLESLSIRDAALYALPTWLPRLPALQRLSLGDLVGASHHSTHARTECQLRVKALAHLKLIESLHFLGTLPKDIGALRNMRELYLNTDAQEIELAVLRPCSKLQTVAIYPSWSVGREKPTLIKGLENLSGLRDFHCRGSRAVNPCQDVIFDLQVGPGASNLEFFSASCAGRFLFIGHKEAFIQFCSKLYYLTVSFLRPQDVSDRDTDAAFHQLFLAADEKGLKVDIRDTEYGAPARFGYKRRALVIKTVNG